MNGARSAEASKIEAHLPKPLGIARVENSLGGFDGFHVVKISAGDFCHFWRSTEVDTGLATFARTPHKGSHPSHHDPGKESVVLAEVTAHEARVEAICGDSRPGLSACKFLGEEDIGKLRTSVDAEGAVVLLGLEVFEVETSPESVSARGCGNDASGPTLPQTLEQEMSQEKVAQVIHSESLLVAVDAGEALLVDQARIVEEYVQGSISSQELAGNPPDVAQVSEVAHNEFKVCLGKSLANAIDGSDSLLPVAGKEVEIRPHLRQGEGAGFAKSCGKARQEHGFSPHVDFFCRQSNFSVAEARTHSISWQPEGSGWPSRVSAWVEIQPVGAAFPGLLPLAFADQIRVAGPILSGGAYGPFGLISGEFQECFGFAPGLPSSIEGFPNRKLRVF